jgi:hypothetical protein
VPLSEGRQIRLQMLEDLQHGTVGEPTIEIYVVQHGQ